MEHGELGPAASRAVLRLTCAVLITGCGSDAPEVRSAAEELPVVIYDSGGVVVVENRADTATLPLWAVEGAPEFAIGSIAAAVGLPDGVAVVADNQAMELHFFADAGPHLLTVGRRGSGPGEFRQIHSMRRSGSGSLVVWDTSLQTATILYSTGAILATSRVLPPEPGTRQSAPPEVILHRLVVPTEGGGWLSVGSTSSPPPLRVSAPLVRQQSMLVLRHDSSGVATDTLARGSHGGLHVGLLQGGTHCGRPGEVSPFQKR
ncbi:hypothetical protein BH23GEM11_BH23GEM11_04420 [soil metagenome]